MTDTQLAAHHLAQAIARLRRLERDVRIGVPAARPRIAGAEADVVHYRGVYAAVLAIAATSAA